MTSGARPWKRDRPRARIWLALQAAGPAGMERAALRQRLQDMEVQDFNAALYQLQQAGYVAARMDGQGRRAVVVVPGMQPRIEDAPAQAASGEAAASAAEATTPEQLGALAKRAAGIVLESASGCDDASLALSLGTTSAQVRRALAPAVLHGKLMSCKTVRGDVAGIRYRRSSGTLAGYEFGASAVAAWKDHAAELEALADVTLSAAVEPAPAPVAQRKQPGRAPAAPTVVEVVEQTSRSQPTRAPAAPTVVEVVEQTSRSQPTRALPIFELDIDAIHGKQRRAEATAAHDGFVCALFSSGELYIESGGTRLTLPVEHTRRLVHYLDRMAEAGDEVGR